MEGFNLANITDAYVGDTQVSAIYKGSTSVWEPISTYQPLDILYSDSLGNLSVSNQVLPVSEGKTPIALCIAGTGFFGANEPARWMSLKYMNYTTPGIGSLMFQPIYWGNFGNNISGVTYMYNTHDGGSYRGYLTDFGTSLTPLIPTLFTENNKWNISILGAVNTYAVTDIDGKNKTDKILTIATAQSTWQTDSSIDNQPSANYTPATCCCARYYTLGTIAGDWYLGACGEMSMILANITSINTKLAAIHAIYPNDCIDSLVNDNYWTSTIYNNYNTFLICTNDGYINSVGKNNLTYVIALLQY